MALRKEAKWLQRRPWQETEMAKKPKPARKEYLRIKAIERRARETAAAKAAGITVKALRVQRHREKKKGGK